MTPIQTGPSSHCPDNMEAGCNILGTYMTTLPCSKAAVADKGLLVAVVNSDFNRSINKSISPLIFQYINQENNKPFNSLII
jgi:hypothetical protein